MVEPQSSPAAAPAAAPQLRIADARCTGYTHADRAREWRLLSIDAINTTLATPLTQLDTRLNTHTGPESILTKGEVAQLLPTHTLRFPTATQAAEAVQCVLLLCGVGGGEGGAVRVSFSLPTALPSYLTLPTWVSPPSQSPLGRYHQSLIEHNVFGVPSEAVVVDGGRGVEVCFTYRHLSVGVHSLPIVLEVADGKWLTLVLEGETVASDDEVVEDMRMLEPVTRDEYHGIVDRLSHVPQLPITACFTHTLAAQPIHLTTGQAPIQWLPLYNDGPGVLQYRMEKVDTNLTDGIWRIHTPSGIVEPYSTAHIAIRFRPTQPRPYELQTLLTVSGGSRSGGVDRRYAVLLMADAVMPDAMSELQFPLPLQLPAVQALLRPGQLARLSCDVVSFGGVPCHSLLARVFVLHSLSSRPLAFALSTADTLSSLLTITPSTGRIEAGGHVVVKVELHSRSGESVYGDASVTCTVNVESDTTQRRHNRQQREASPTTQPYRTAATEDDDDEGDIVLASSDGRFSVNHTHTLQRIHGNALRFPTHPPIASRLTRQSKAVPAAVRLNALGVSGRVEDDKRRRAKVGRGDGREEKEREEEQRIVMDGMERAYSQLNQPSASPPIEATASRNSDTLQLRVLARVLPLSLLEEEELQRVRRSKQQATQEKGAEEKKPMLASQVRQEEEQAIAHWRQQFYFPPMTVLDNPPTDIPPVAASAQQQSIARLVHEALYGRVVDAAFSELSPARPAQWADVKRRLAGAVEEKRAEREEKEAEEDDDMRERRVWERREQLEAEMMDKVRALVLEQSTTATRSLPPTVQ